MSDAAFKSFEDSISRLVAAFERDIAQRGGEQMSEAALRLQYLDRLFEALGWDVGNRALTPFHGREVVVEPPHQMQGSNRRPDYLFRVNGIDKFVCEAKRPHTDLSRYHFQVQNYIFNLKLWIGVLTDFEQFEVFLVGSQPDRKRPFSPLDGWRIHYKSYATAARQIWDAFARDKVADGSLDRLAQAAVKVYRPGKQGWLIKPERAKRIDGKFLEFLEDQRARLARSLHRRNSELDGAALTEATQKIIDRLLFQRICEDRNIDVGRTLSAIIERWERGGRVKGQLWPAIVANFRHMSRTFNGGLYGKPKQPPHRVESVDVDDAWLADFLEELAGDDSNYLLAVIPVEILGNVYERFLGSVVTDKGQIELKPELRKSKGVYYTPKAIVDEIVERTVGQAISGKSPQQLRNFRVADPACGSGSFLLAAFERLCREHLAWLLAHPEEQKRQLCYKSASGDLRLTTGFKREILVRSIFGVDIDGQAVEVTQMSLYLKVLEDETAESLNADHRLFPTETYLPNLDDNIKVGDSLIELGSLMDLAGPETDDAEAKAFDWRAEFPRAFKAGGFDAIVGNPPYFSIEKTWGKKDFRLQYFKTYYSHVYQDRSDILFYFLARAAELSKGPSCFIVSRAFLEAHKAEKLRGWLASKAPPSLIIDFGNRYVFEGVGITTAIVTIEKGDKHEAVPVFRARHKKNDERPVSIQLADPVTFDQMAVPRPRFSSAPWLFGTEREHSLINKIDRNTTPAERVFLIGQGMQTGRNDVFGRLPLSVVKEWKLPQGAWFVRARNSDIQSWIIHNSDEILLYPNAFGRLKEMPEAMREHLQRNRKKLTERAAYQRGNCEWWQYTWPLHAERYEEFPRILSPFLATKNRFAIDADRKFLGLTDTIVMFPRETREDLRYFLGLLNSKVLTWRFRFIGKLKSGGIREYFHNSVAKMPLHRIDWNSPDEVRVHDGVVKLATRLESLASGPESASRRAAAERVENELAAAVCLLYGLSESDYALISKDLEAEASSAEADAEAEAAD